MRDTDSADVAAKRASGRHIEDWETKRAVSDLAEAIKLLV